MQQVEFVSFEFQLHYMFLRVCDRGFNGVIRVPVWCQRDLCHATLSSVGPGDNDKQCEFANVERLRACLSLWLMSVPLFIQKLATHTSEYCWTLFWTISTLISLLAWFHSVFSDESQLESSIYLCLEELCP